MRRGPVVAALAAAILLAPHEVRADPPVDLAGTWYVLVHYKDSQTEKPEQMRWDDRLWIFERTPAGLKWTEYPIVVFQDESGRFESLGGNRAARVLAAWEPNERQRQEIAAGLEYNTRGGKSKTLRGSDGAGWRSGAAATGGSANVLTYTETWTIDGPSSKPVFTRDDELGGGGAESAEGRTQYRTTTVSADGAELQGTFDRDGTRTGTFRMMRAGQAGVVKGSGKTNEERLREMFMGSVGAALANDPEMQRDLQQMRKNGDVPEEFREQVRRSIRDEIQRKARAKPTAAQPTEAELDSLSHEIEHLMIDEGKTPAEIDRMIQDGRIRP